MSELHIADAHDLRVERAKQSWRVDPDPAEALRRHALHYARSGEAVLALHEPADNTARCSCGHDDCSSPAKHPRTPHGLDDATDDHAVIERWWTRWPRANVGIRTGIRFDVLDVDPRHGGLDTLSELLGGDDAPLPGGAIAYTPHGGVHICFEPTGVGNKVGFLPGLDWRGKRGYVLVSPSVGANGVRYEWDESTLVGAGRVPGWLRRLVERADESNTRSAGRSNGFSVNAGAGLGNKGPAYLRAALENEARAVEHAPVGARNDQLNRSTHTLARLVGDGLDVTTIRTVMAAAAADSGLTEREAEATINSALKARGVV